MTHHIDGPPPDRGPAPARLAFTPAAIMARAHAHAADQARRAAARPVTPPAPGAPTGPEILAAIAAEIAQAEARQAVAMPRGSWGDPTNLPVTATLPRDLLHRGAKYSEPLQRDAAELLASIAREIDGGRP